MERENEVEEYVSSKI